ATAGRRDRGHRCADLRAHRERTRRRHPERRRQPPHRLRGGWRLGAGDRYRRGESRDTGRQDVGRGREPASGHVAFDGDRRRSEPRSGRVLATMPVSSNALYLAAGEAGAWVLDTFAATVTFIDGASNEAHSPVGVGTSPNGIAVGLGAIWVADADGSLYRL